MRFKSSLMFAVAAGAMLLASTGAASAVTTVPATITPAYEYTSSSFWNLGTHYYTLGFEFTLSSPETVNALGYNTEDFSSDQLVGIWNSSGALLTSTNVSLTDTVVGHFAWAPISSINLAPGTYTIGGTFTGGSLPTLGSGDVTTIAGYSWVTSEWSSGPGLNFPASGGVMAGLNGFTQVDFSVGGDVPEPATWAMFLVGFGAMGFMMRGARRKAAAVTV